MSGLMLLPILASMAWSHDVSVSIQAKERGTYEVEGRFTAQASPQRAWAVLTDYERLPQFVSSLKSSKVEQQSGDTLLISQVSVGEVYFFRKTLHVLLSVHEQPTSQINFIDLSKRSFDVYEGSWDIVQGSSGTVVTYRLKAKGGFVSPKFVTKGASRKMVRALLEQVRDEIERQDQLGSFVAPKQSTQTRIREEEL